MGDKDSLVSEDITESDQAIFFKIISIDMDEEQRKRITVPSQVYLRQEHVLAVHWHPEFIPMDLIEQRIHAMFPDKKNELIIPTQHNELSSCKEYTGVEVDCYSEGFNQKVQLLLHFKNEKLEQADVLKQMLSHTFKYRSHQLFEFIHTLTAPNEERLLLAARQTGANESLIHFVQTIVKKIETLLDQNYAIVPPISIKNKLLRNFFDCLRKECGNGIIDRAQTFLQAVKMIVKSNSSLTYFYRTSEIIEESRSLGAGIVIPHPEQFWPVLLADYDVDGVEVWNPQSQRYTEFLISVIDQKNRQTNRNILIFMGDDTHMSEKTRDPAHQDKEKVSREIGVQPSWDNLNIRKTLIKANVNRENVIEEYKHRLEG